MNRTLFLALGVLATLPLPLSAQQENHVLRCNGTTDYIASGTLPASANTFTMEAWVRPAATHEVDAESQSGCAGIAGQRYAIYPVHGIAWGTGHAGAGFSVGTNGVTIYEHAGDYMPAVLVYEGKIEGWTHVAVVYRDRQPHLYINGMLVKSGRPGPIPDVHPSAGLLPSRYHTFGGIGGGPYGFFEGELDDVRLWSVARSDEEIRNSMNVADITSPALLASYGMDRSGSGAGLTVENEHRAAELAGTTMGTTATPVFVPQESRIEQRGTTGSEILR